MVTEGAQTKGVTVGYKEGQTWRTRWRGTPWGTSKVGVQQRLETKASEMRPDWGLVWVRNFPMSKKGFLIYFRESLDSDP